MTEDSGPSTTTAPNECCNDHPSHPSTIASSELTATSSTLITTTTGLTTTAGLTVTSGLTTTPSGLAATSTSLTVTATSLAVTSTSLAATSTSLAATSSSLAGSTAESSVTPTDLSAPPTSSSVPTATSSVSPGVATTSDSLSSQRVFKKSSPNNKLTLYLSSRDLVVSDGKIDRLQGVLLVDPEFIEQRKVYGQVTLTFRYGREDEEVMGLKFCNEAVMCLAQLYPPHPAVQQSESITPLQEALLRRLGPNAYPFNMEITPLAPPSVQLVPAKEYNGAPIGTSYDVRAYIAYRADEKLHRRTTVRMGIRVVQRAFAPPSPYLYNPGGKCTTITTSATKERHKHKITLFGCKSAPLESKTLKQSPNNKSRSVEVGLEMNTRLKNKKIEEDSPNLRRENDDNQQQHATLTSKEEDRHTDGDASKNEPCRLTENTELPLEIKTPTHVTFMDNSTSNDVENDESLNRVQSKTNPDQFDTDNAEDKTADIASCCENESTQMEHIRKMCGGKRPSLAAFLAEVPAPCAIMEKQFLLSDGKIYLEASLDKAIYYHGEEVEVSVDIRNNSNKTIKRIKVFIVQHVDVCMFSNGKFKNVVAMINSKDDCPLGSNQSLHKTYSLVPVKSCTKNWIALEDSYTKVGTNLASSVTCTTNNPEERNVFAIYVSYYVKVKLLVSVMGGEVSLKLPFTLMHTCNDYDPSTTLTRVIDPPSHVQLELKPTHDTTIAPDDVKQEKDGT